MNDGAYIFDIKRLSNTLLHCLFCTFLDRCCFAFAKEGSLHRKQVTSILSLGTIVQSHVTFDTTSNKRI